MISGVSFNIFVLIIHLISIFIETFSSDSSFPLMTLTKKGIIIFTRISYRNRRMLLTTGIILTTASFMIMATVMTGIMTGLVTGVTCRGIMTDNTGEIREKYRISLLYRGQDLICFFLPPHTF